MHTLTLDLSSLSTRTFNALCVLLEEKSYMYNGFSGKKILHIKALRLSQLADIVELVYRETAKRHAVNIVWDTDGETPDLPTSVAIPAYIADRHVAGYLSDKYGWLVRSSTLRNGISANDVTE